MYSICDSRAINNLSFSVIYSMNIMSRFWSNSLLLNHVTIKRRGCLLVIYTATLVNGIKMFNLYLREAMNCYIIAKRLGLKKVSKYIHVFKYPLGHIYLKNTHFLHFFCFFIYGTIYTRFNIYVIYCKPFLNIATDIVGLHPYTRK